MTDERMALVELLQKSGDGDFLRAVAEAVLQILMEADVEGLVGAGRHERSADRLNYRNGYREQSVVFRHEDPCRGGCRQRGRTLPENSLGETAVPWFGSAAAMTNPR